MGNINYTKLIVFAVIILLYLVKHRFKNGTRVRYIAIYKTDDRYLSYDAFWKWKHLKKRLYRFIGRPTKWSFLPIVSNRVIISDIVFIARGRFKNKYTKVKTSQPIKSINLINPTYHISVNAHINIKTDSRKIDKAVAFNGRCADLEYGKNYMIIFEDDTGYVLKIRK